MSTKKTGILEEGGPRHKRKPCELSAHEVFLLMRVFMRDKILVTEEDCLAVCRWAQAQKLGAYVLRLVLEGHLAVAVEDGTVKVVLLPSLTGSTH